MNGRLAIVLIAAAVASAARTAHAEETVEAAVWAASRRPLAPPELQRNVAGIGVEWIDAPARSRTGWTLRFGAAVEHQADCARVEPQCAFPGAGDAHVEGGAHVRVGWMWRHVQLEGGIVAFSRTTPATPAPIAESKLLPDAVVRVGTRTVFLAFGYGTHAAPTMLAPLFFAQAEIGFAERWTTTLTAGTRPLDDVLRHDRYDFGMRYQLTKTIRIGEGLALASAYGRLGGEARLELGWSF